ncbi:AAA family ATPase [Candidatus Poriferisocius sp.]|uniref:AAA family ATPase n=1 Tax=Candidatus Poriferisocius sp. TaxID=3101276 RepID=UPI003B021951
MTIDSTLFFPSALLSFRAANVRSFRDDLELSLLATKMGEKRYSRSVPWQQKGSSRGVLAVAGIFGANGSGKSNLLKAMNDMRRHVLLSFRSGNPTGGMPRQPFLLDPDLRSQPSRYEVDVVVGGVRHEYGFIIDDQEVLEEWAYWYPKGRAALIFRRERDQVETGAIERQKTRAVQEVLRPNALLLSTAASAKHVTLLRLHQWFEQNLLFADAHSRAWRQALTTKMLNNDGHRQRILDLLRAADLGITDARKHELNPVVQERLRRAARILYGIEEEPDGDDEPTFEELDIRLVHRAAGGHTMELPAGDESLGTRVWFGLIGPVVQALESGSVLCTDELDASLHPALVAELVRLFQDPETNPQHAQLMFNSHDPTLLGNTVDDRLMGRDQVWFTEKVNEGSTRLYPLTDLEPRKQEAIGKRYLEGRYGATPILSHHEFAAAVEPELAGSH